MSRGSIYNKVTHTMAAGKEKRKDRFSVSPSRMCLSLPPTTRSRVATSQFHHQLDPKPFWAFQTQTWTHRAAGSPRINMWLFVPLSPHWVLVCFHFQVFFSSYNFFVPLIFLSTFHEVSFLWFHVSSKPASWNRIPSYLHLCLILRCNKSWDQIIFNKENTEFGERRWTEEKEIHQATTITERKAPLSHSAMSSKLVEVIKMS